MGLKLKEFFKSIKIPKLPLWLWDIIFTVITIIPLIPAVLYDLKYVVGTDAWIGSSTLVLLFFSFPFYIVFSVFFCIKSCKSEEKFFAPYIFRGIVLPVICGILFNGRFPLALVNALLLAIYFLKKNDDKKALKWFIGTVALGLILTVVGHFLPTFFKLSSLLPLLFATACLGFVYGAVTYAYLEKMNGWFFSLMMPLTYTPIFSGGAFIGMLLAKLIFKLFGR